LNGLILPAFLLAFIAACVALDLRDGGRKRLQEGQYRDAQAGATDNTEYRAGRDQPPRPANPPHQKGWHPEEKEHRRIQRGYWRDQKRSGVANTIISLCALIGAATSVCVAYLAFDDSITANRAYMAPVGLYLVKPLESGFPIRVQLHIENVGKEPAFGTVWRISQPIVKDYIADAVPLVHESENWRNAMCDGLKPDTKSGPAFFANIPQPLTMIPLVVFDSIANEIALRRTLQRSGSMYLDGCIAYLAGGARRTTSFRFLLRDVPGMSDIWKFNRALSGNDAN
jgi:hypothetical protein